MTSSVFPEEISSAIKEGDHTVAIQKVLNREFKAKSRAHNRWKEKVIKELEGKDKPSFDTGYQRIDVGETYEFKYGSDRIPNNALCFFSTEETPRLGRDEIYVVAPALISNRGFSLSFFKKGWARVVVGSTAIIGSETSGYLRIQFWR